MIYNLKEENQNLIWLNDFGEKKQINLEGGTYIYSKDYVFLMNESRDEVKVYDSNKHVITEVHNSDSVELMYLVDHFKFGLSIVVSVKNEYGWLDRHLMFDGSNFIPVSEAR